MFKLSAEATLDGYVTVENKFIIDYLPYADGDYVRVYLYALFLSAHGDGADDLASLARRLGLDAATADAAVEYWSELGLMSRLGDDITFFPIRDARPKIKKYDVDKYSEFNRMAQSFLRGRQMPPREFDEYYALMEKLNIEWQALVHVIRYCVDLKGDNVSCPYILTVARNLAQDGYRTDAEISERLEEYGVYYNDLRELLGVLSGGSKRPDHESVQTYKKWRKAYRYDPALIAHVAREHIKRGGMATLDYKLTQYHDAGFVTAEQIDGYETERKALYKLAKSVNKALGVYYENTDPEIAAYIKPWLDMGFEPNALVAIAEYCMRAGLKTLGDLDAVVRGDKFLAAARLTEKQVAEFIDAEKRFDGKIEKLMAKLGLIGAVTGNHRAYYAIWSENRGMPDEVIDYAATLAAGKTNPFAYMNKILLDWHGKGITTVDGAKASGAYAASGDAAPANATVNERYTAEQLNSLFIDLTEDD